MGFFSDLGDGIKARLNPKTIAAEMFETITDRVIPHGAAEVAQALFTQGTGYLPYGQEPMAVEATTHTEASPEPALSNLEQYQANLAMYAQRGNPARDQTPTL